jgi:signal transduction histidine kinase
MNPYSILPAISAAAFLLLGIFILYKSNEKKPLKIPLFLNCFVTFWWQFSWVILFNINSLSTANVIAKIGYTGITLIPPTFFHFHASRSQFFNYKKQIILYYLISIFFIFLLWCTDDYIKGVYHYYWGFYPKANWAHLIFLSYLVWVALHCLLCLFKEGIKSSWHGTKGNQLKFLIFAFLIYFLASSDFVVNYGFEFYPLGVVAILICLLISIFAIVKYRLMEIRLAVTNAGIFLTIYLIVLGIPIGVGFNLLGNGPWLIPMILMAVLATSGPFVYLYFQRRAEAKILLDQRHYQSTLRKASLGMGRIKDLKRLLGLIVHIVTKTVRIEHCSIYLFHETSKQYVLKSSKGVTSKPLQSVLQEDSDLLRYLNKIKEPIVCEEIYQKKNDSNDPELAGVVEDLKNIDCTIIVPSFIEQRLLAIIILGPKRSGKIYSHDDLVVFSILANQSALAIENAQFYEDMKRTHEQLFKAEKMATIGTMADGLSHQINNRLHAIGFVASDALDTIKIKQKDGVPEDMKEVMDDVAYALERIQDNVKRGGEIVGGLLKYTRKGSRGFEPLQLEKLFNAAIEMAGFKIKPGLVEFVTYLHPNLSPVVGNFTQLQEVFFNIIDNAYDAIVQRKEDLREEKYKGKIEILAVNKGKNVEIRIKDNGIGAKPEILAKLFTPFFTTKLSSRKGTGLGLYIIRQIIEENHHGSVKFDSRYGIGSETHIILPTGRPEEERSENAENTDDALEQPIN